MVLLAVLGMGRNAEAQNYVGMKLGANGPSGPYPYHYRGLSSSVHIGLFGEFGLKNALFIRPEMNVVQHRYWHNHGGGIVHALHVQHLQIPVLIKYKFGSGALQPHVLGGPYLTLFHGGEEYYYFRNEATYYNSSSWRSSGVGAGLQMGGGVDYSTGNWLLGTDLRLGAGSRAYYVEDDTDYRYHGVANWYWSIYGAFKF